tara:strand:+ start:720 stop:932 length:213 start_codon:yes stop_codon:yes gene_type:complete
MINFFYFLFIILFITSCSVDTKSGFWINKSETTNFQKLSDLQFDYDQSFEEFKQNVIIYGEKSKFPKLDN